MDEIIKIKCPFCGAVLSVKNMPGIETKSVTCPICKHKHPFTQFKVVNAATNKYDDPPTDYPGGNQTHHHSEDETEVGQENLTIGRLKLQGTAIDYQLKPGRNIIGRKATQSQANFQIDTGGIRLMSREHIVVEVKRVPKKGFVHYLSLYKEKVNATYIGNDQLFYGDCMVLNHGDVIRLPGTTLKFIIPDNDATDF